MTYMLTTFDNPYDPFTQFDEWYAMDESLGYHTTSYLARIVVTSDELSESDQVVARELAIDEIIEVNINGMYTKVSNDSQGVFEIFNPTQR
jgi:hypothetical protein